MSKLKVYIVSGSYYLGNREENTITGMVLQSDARVVQENFADYMKAKQVDELRQVEVGINSDIGIRSLTRREELDFKMVKAEFKEAKAMAEDHLINQVFDQFRMGKS